MNRTHPDIRSTLRDWSRQCAEPWLAAHLGRLLDRGDAWSHAVGLGLGARHGAAIPDPTRALARLLSGEDEPAPPAPLLWARNQSPDVIAYLGARGSEVADELEGRLRWLLDNVDLSDGDWKAGFVGALHTRDDLEGIALLVSEGCERGSASPGVRPLKQRLQTLDATGRLLVASVPKFTVDDERLLRTVRLAENGWWMDPVLW